APRRHISFCPPSGSPPCSPGPCPRRPPGPTRRRPPVPPLWRPVPPKTAHSFCASFPSVKPPLGDDAIQPDVQRPRGGRLHFLYLIGHPVHRRAGAPGKIPVIVAFAHAHPPAGLVKGGTGHQNQVQALGRED